MTWKSVAEAAGNLMIQIGYSDLTKVIDESPDWSIELNETGIVVLLHKLSLTTSSVTIAADGVVETSSFMFHGRPSGPAVDDHTWEVRHKRKIGF